MKKQLTCFTVTLNKKKTPKKNQHIIGKKKTQNDTLSIL